MTTARASYVLAHFGHTITYSPRLASSLGDPAAAIFLSQMLYWQVNPPWSEKMEYEVGRKEYFIPRSKDEGGRRWIRWQIEELGEQLGLPPAGIRRGRKILEGLGLLLLKNDRLAGNKMWWSVDFDAVDQFLTRCLETKDKNGISGDCSTTPCFKRKGGNRDSGRSNMTPPEAPKSRFFFRIRNQNKTTTRRRGDLDPDRLARATLLANDVKQAVEHHRAQYALACITEDDWQIAAEALARVAPSMMEQVSRQWRTALRVTGERKLVRPVAYLKKLVHAAQAGEFETTSVLQLPPAKPKNENAPTYSTPEGLEAGLKLLKAAKEMAR